MLETANLSCVRGDRILFEELSFSVQDGELVHVVGPNGAGKTSLIRMMCGLVAPAMGEVRWRGQNIRKQKEEFNSELLYLGHQLGIKAELTAVENLRISCAMSNQALADDDAWRALDEIGLRGREDLPTKVLSQGQQRRVALARLLVSRAKLWILDEPFTALDVKAVAQLEAVLGRHLASGGMIVLTTHQAFSLPQGRMRQLVLENRRGILQ
ncbi:MAG: cytochrome c biogenesis heme-transporting ATPase CcmA [Gammaproteobacteria bacterium]|nr:cytochrome c biogenesis heme-transporting ATPase CcmA [Gammaproteobacteria bacterium]